MTEPLNRRHLGQSFVTKAMPILRSSLKRLANKRSALGVLQSDARGPLNASAFACPTSKVG
jgi:hypothetical protein